MRIKDLNFTSGFNTVHIFLLTLFFYYLPFTACSQGNSQQLPAKFIGNRIFVQPITEQGDTLNLYTDTGGALVLTRKLVEKLQLETEEISLRNRTMKVSSFPPFVEEASVPAPPIKVAPADASSLQKKYDRLNGRLFVRTPPKMLEDHIGEGMLGQDWFATRVWTFDYASQELIYHPSFVSNDSDKQKIPVYFKEDKKGRHLMHFPRVQVEIDGETFNFLLDTGATLLLKDMVHEALDDGEPQARGTSYITRSQFEEWHFAHPEWKIYEDVEKGHSSNMIRVPEVTIGEYTVGPVWFTTRPDNNFLKGMSKFTDEQVVGALGGSILKYFRFTINYPQEYIVFERVES